MSAGDIRGTADRCHLESKTGLSTEHEQKKKRGLQEEDSMCGGSRHLNALDDPFNERFLVDSDVLFD